MRKSAGRVLDYCSLSDIIKDQLLFPFEEAKKAWRDISPWRSNIQLKTARVCGEKKGGAQNMNHLQKEFSASQLIHVIDNTKRVNSIFSLR